MALDGFVRSWSGVAFRHIPADSPYDVFDFRFAALASKNRWNYQGQATLYLASDRGVALGEFARHLREDRFPAIGGKAIARSVFRLELSIERLIDLRDADLCAALSLRNAPYCFLDKDLSRAVAQFLRQTTAAQAILVPSMAFLDHRDRWIAALFLEKLPADPRQFLTTVRLEGRFQVSP